MELLCSESTEEPGEVLYPCCPPKHKGSHRACVASEHVGTLKAKAEYLSVREVKAGWITMLAQSQCVAVP